MEGSETGGAWVGTGQKRQDGGERDGRRMGGDGGGEGRWRRARREACGWGRGWGGKMQGSETGGAWVGTGLGREDGGERDIVAPQALWGSAEVSMGGGSAGPCFAEGRREVNGAVAGRRYCLGCPKCTACLRQTMLR